MTAHITLRPLGVLLAAASLAAGCVDNGHGTDELSCVPLVKFSNPEGVTPQAVDGVVTLPIEASTCDRSDLALWAWSSEGDRALDVYEDEAGGRLVSVPVSAALDQPCDTSTITIALVDDSGDVVDQDRTFLHFAVAR